MKAIFPNGKLLQPMPTPSVHANVSGNINNATQVSPTISNTQSAQNNLPLAQQNGAKNENGFSFFAPWCIITLLVILVIIFTYKKLKRN
jgi:hypothetical protein